MRIETERLIITELTMDMAQDIHENSLDEDTRKFVPDEVFETLGDAQEVIACLISAYSTRTGPFVYAVLSKEDGRCIGYVQMIPLEEGQWEVGYHIGKKYTGCGFATEALRAFLPVMKQNCAAGEVYGICLKENGASIRVLEKCGFTELYSGPGIYQGVRRDIVRTIHKA